MTRTGRLHGAEGRLWTRIAAIVAIIFGLATIREGGAVLLGHEDALRAAGRDVPFVVWFNAAAGFGYVAAGIGLWLRQRWAVGLAFAIVAATLAVFAAFGAHVAGGGEYALRTVIAMSLRSAVWLAIALVAYRLAWTPKGKAAR
ncbi:MAG: hypothetical protein ACOY3L_11025 [Pseudomonadota bacterium]